MAPGREISPGPLSTYRPLLARECARGTVGHSQHTPEVPVFYFFVKLAFYPFYLLARFVDQLLPGEPFFKDGRGYWW